MDASYVFRSVKGSVTIVTKLYGEITPERIAKETAIGAHRADQLEPVSRESLIQAEMNRWLAEDRKTRDELFLEDFEEDYDDVMSGSFQSTGR